MVPQERFELSRLSAAASKTAVSAVPPPGQITNMVVTEGNDPSCEPYESPAYPSRLCHRKLVEVDGIEPTTLCLQSIRSPN